MCHPAVPRDFYFEAAENVNQKGGGFTRVLGLAGWLTKGGKGD